MNNHPGSTGNWLGTLLIFIMAVIAIYALLMLNQQVFHLVPLPTVPVLIGPTNGDRFPGGL
jgi:hypothetical protein